MHLQRPLYEKTIIILYLPPNLTVGPGEPTIIWTHRTIQSNSIGICRPHSPQVKLNRKAKFDRWTTLNLNIAKRLPHRRLLQSLLLSPSKYNSSLNNFLVGRRCRCHRRSFSLIVFVVDCSVLRLLCCLS